MLPVRVKLLKQGERQGEQQGWGEPGLELCHLLQLHRQGRELVDLIEHCRGTAGSSVLSPHNDSRDLGDGDTHI